MHLWKQRNLIKGLLCVGLCFAPLAAAEKLEDLLPGLLEQHEQLLAARANTEQARQTWTQSKGDILPSLDATLSQGYEKQLKPGGSADTKTGRNAEEINLSQLLYDWGGTSARIRSAQLKYYRSKLQAGIAEQSLILRSAQSYLQLLRSVEALRYSQRSEANIKKQTGLEEARVKRGSGLSTDVLQTKSSLAGAMATRVRNEGAVVSASNRFRATFRRGIPLDALETPRVPFEKVPNTLEDAISIAKRKSLNLQQARLDVLIAQMGIKSAASRIGPRLDLKASAKHRHNDSGLLGTKEEYLAKVDLKIPLYSGGKNISGYRSAREALAAAEYTLRDTEFSVEERVRNAWQNLSTSRSNAQFLRNQANISGEFLDFARKERKLGTRSLLDVLNGETAYINALSSAVSAETDMAVAVFTLLQAMGELTPDVFEMQTVPAPSDSRTVLPMIAPTTSEASDASAAARQMSSRLESQRDLNFPDSVLEKEDEDLGEGADVLTELAFTEDTTTPSKDAAPVKPKQETVLSKPRIPSSPLAEIETRPASVTDPVSALDSMLTEVQEAVPTPLSDTEVENLLNKMAAKMKRLKGEASVQENPASISNVNDLLEDAAGVGG